MAVRPRITDEQRRARQWHRQLLDRHEAPPTVAAVADRLVALHATTASTVYLSTWARAPQLTVGDVDAALYEHRSVVKHLGMRRTLFVTSQDVLDEVLGAVSARVAASERTNMLRDLRRSPDIDDPDTWIDTACAAALAALDAGGPQPTRQLRAAVPILAQRIEGPADSSWGGPMQMGSRILNYLAASGQIVRGPDDGPWYTSRITWGPMARWLGREPAGLSLDQGHLGLIERWLRVFGPGTETDIAWWLGSTKTAVRRTLAQLQVVEVDLDDGQTGYVLPDDAETADPAPDDDAVTLLPELDPTTMGHKQRGFFLGETEKLLFDRNGNGGTTAWWRGQVVGGWLPRPAGDARGPGIELVLCDKVPARVERALRARGDELARWCAPAPVPRGLYLGPAQKAAGHQNR
ncbi:winged helix DNA-binding domain-containing protein [Gordonia defluvii]|uniref:Winged helix DNA-binding domain-containing protein n=1 Tax=Gordonia defluvii TaxID=283718 RepID=A0ABP6L284_9ACTN|nr:winged helix DNA-binding domain-containing protein [Gordonia sp. UBA5067]